MKQLLYLAHPYDKTYNKSVASIQQFASVFPRLVVQEIPVDDRSSSRRKRVATRVAAYLNIWRATARLPCHAVCLSDLKYTLVNLLFARALSWRLHAVLIGGPHVMRLDMIYFKNPTIAATGYSRRPLDLLRTNSLWLRERLKLALVDVLQSYTRAYAERVLGYCHARKPLLIVPVSAPTRERLPAVASVLRPEITLVFWGYPTVLHGLSLLPEAIRQLRGRGIPVDVMIYAPANDTLRAVLLDAEELGVRHLFRVEDRVLNTNWGLLSGQEIGISHLISPALSFDARQACDAVTTNKMFEILSLGLPLLVADTGAVREAVGPDECLLVSPGSVESVVAAVKRAYDHPAALGRTAETGHRAFLRRLAPQQTAQFIKDQLSHLNRA